MENEPRIVINEMPEKELLEDFVNGLCGSGQSVIFDIVKGEFIRKNPVDILHDV